MLLLSQSCSFCNSQGLRTTHELHTHLVGEKRSTSLCASAASIQSFAAILLKCGTKTTTESIDYFLFVNVLDYKSHNWFLHCAAVLATILAVGSGALTSVLSAEAPWKRRPVCGPSADSSRLGQSHLVCHR